MIFRDADWRVVFLMVACAVILYGVNTWSWLR